MKHAARAILLLAAIGLPLAAAEQDEPLAGVKQELKQLQSDNAAQKNGDADPKLKSSLPLLILPANSSTPVDPAATRRKLEQERKKQKAAEKEKDWLLREYDKLDSKADNQRGDSLADAQKLQATSSSAASGHDDAQHPLTLIDQLSDTKNRDSRVGAPRDLVGVPDPLAPFMKEWMANSPVRGPAFDSLLSAPGNGPAGSPSSVDSGTAGSSTSVLTAVGLSDSGRSQRPEATPASNPFLSGLEMPHEGVGSPAPSGPVADVVVPAAAPLRSDLLVAPVEIDSGKRNSVTPPPSKLADDKKYFPQQKRF